MKLLNTCWRVAISPTPTPALGLSLTWSLCHGVSSLLPLSPSSLPLFLQSKGGVVLQRYGSGIARVMGVLAVSRALGDLSLKPYITCEPDVVALRRAVST